MLIEPEDIDKYLINKYRYYPALTDEFDNIGYFKFVMFNDNTTQDDLVNAYNESVKFGRGFGINIGVVVNTEHDVYERHQDMIDTFISEYDIECAHFVERRGRPQKKWDRDAITEKQAWDMVSVCDEEKSNAERKHFMVVGIYYTGMRIGEFVAMRPHWIEMNDGILVINIPRQEGDFKTKTAAGEREIYITDKKVIATISRWFKNHDSFGMSDVSAWQWCVSLAEKAGIDKRVTPHILRHSCISRWAWEGILSEETIRKMAGHKNFSVTIDTYIHSFKGEIPPDVLKTVGKGDKGEQE